MTRENPANIDDLLARILAQVLTLLDCDAASIFLREGDRLVLRASTAKGFHGPDSLSYRIGEGVTGLVQSTGQSVRIQDLQDAWRVTEKARYDEAELSRAEAQGMLAVPIKVADEIIGVLRCVTKTGNSKKLSEDDVQTALIFAETAGMAIEASQELRLFTSAPYAFVLMPFASSFRDTYELAIKHTLTALGFRCERVDEIQFNDSVLEQIYKSIQVADLIIADMTGKNPNVFYEVGYAHALKKPVILLTRDAGDIPFDLKHHNHIVYGDSLSDLRTRLIPRIEAWLRRNES